MEKKNQNTLFGMAIGKIGELKESLAETADAAVDFLTDGSLMNGVPGFSVAVKFLTFKDNLAALRFERNCIAMYQALSTASIEDVQLLQAKLDADPQYKEDFSDVILSVLVDGQKPLKGAITGNLVTALARGSITQAEFETIAQIVHTASIPALKGLATFVDSQNGVYGKNGGARVPEEPLLLSLGIASRSGTSFRISDLGERLHKYGMCSIDGGNVR